MDKWVSRLSLEESTWQTPGHKEAKVMSTLNGELSGTHWTLFNEPSSFPSRQTQVTPIPQTLNPGQGADQTKESQKMHTLQSKGHFLNVLTYLFYSLIKKSRAGSWENLMSRDLYNHWGTVCRSKLVKQRLNWIMSFGPVGNHKSFYSCWVKLFATYSSLC